MSKTTWLISISLISFLAQIVLILENKPVNTAILSIGSFAFGAVVGSFRGKVQGWLWLLFMLACIYVAYIG